MSRNETLLLILGAGGHGRVVADIARSLGRFDRIAFLDDQREGERVGAWEVAGRLSAYEEVGRSATRHYALGLGDNGLRAKWHAKLEARGASLPVLVAPSAYLSPDASLGPGGVLMPQAAVNIGARLGPACIVNTGATVDHDARIGTAVHLSPGAHLGGNVHIGDESWIGAGAAVKHGIRIGSRVIVGVGAAVVEDLKDGVVATGVPARPRR